MSLALAFMLASAAIGIVAGLWLCVGSAFTSSAKLAELAGTYWDYHPSQARAFVEQTSQYSVGAPLLVLAFALQVGAAVVPPERTAVLPGIINSPVPFLFACAAVAWVVSYAAYRALVRVKGRRVHEILSAEVAKGDS